ncbi:MAG: ion channel [Pseudomonadota bacterium]
MKSSRVQRLAGMGGVVESENARARTWAARFEVPMLLLALWIPLQWYMELKGLLQPSLGRLADWLVWSLFVLETTVLSTLVADRATYLRHNWMNLLIIAGGLPLIWNITPLAGMLRSLRLLLLLSLFLRFSSTVRAMLRHNSIGAALGAAAVVILLSGLVMAAIEPTVHSPWDGIWWAWVTVTTVGYGDIVPQTPAGKLFGALLILLGVALFALMTASFSSFFIGRDVSKVEQGIERDVSKLEREDVDIRSMMERLARVLARLDERMALLERKEQEVSQVEHSIAREFDQERRKEIALHTLIEKMGESLSRIETRLEGVERRMCDKYK